MGDIKLKDRVKTNSLDTEGWESNSTYFVKTLTHVIPYITPQQKNTQPNDQTTKAKASKHSTRTILMQSVLI